jgi:integrase
MPKKKTGRRGNGEGSIYERSKGKWAAVLTVGQNANGSPKRKFMYGNSRAEVAEKLHEAQALLKAGGYIDPGKITVGEWLEIWLENYVRPNIRQSTYESYRLQIDNHLIPGLGKKQLKKLTTTDIQLMYKNLLERGNKTKVKNPDTENLEPSDAGLAPATLVCIRNILKAALEQAVNERKLQINPAKATKVPKVEKREMTVLSQAEITQFLNATKHYRYYAAYVLALSTGIRRGEVLGLPWVNIVLGIDWKTLDKALPWERIGKLDLWDTDALDALLHDEHIDIGDAAIQITQQLSDLRDGPRLEIPKTTLSRRKIDIPHDTALTLIFQRYQQRRERKEAGTGYNTDDLVFCTGIGAYVAPKTFTNIFHGALKHAGVKKVRFHDLRHTVATVLLEDGTALNTVQELLGHYNAAFTATQYGHVTKKMRSEATVKLGNMLQAAKRNPNHEGEQL